MTFDDPSTSDSPADDEKHEEHVDREEHKEHEELEEQMHLLFCSFALALAHCL